MSANLIEIAISSIHGHIDALSVILDESSANTHAAVDATIPVLIGGLVRGVKTKPGAERIFHSLDDFDGSTLDNLAGLLAGGNHFGLLQKSQLALAVHVGDDYHSSVSSVATKVGLDEAKIETLFRLLAPLLLAILSQQKHAQALDLEQVTSLVCPQRNKTVLPASLDERDSTHTASSDTAGRLIKTWIPVVLLLAIVVAGYRSLTPGGAGDAAANLPTIKIPGFDTAGIHRTMTELTDAIGGVRDESSAELAVPKVQAAAAVIGEIDLGAIAEGPEKDVANRFFGDIRRQLKAAVDQAYAVPGVRAILEPHVGPLSRRFDVFSS